MQTAKELCDYVLGKLPVDKKWTVTVSVIACYGPLTADKVESTISLEIVERGSNNAYTTRTATIEAAQTWLDEHTIPSIQEQLHVHATV